jgi:hypothetical protein
MSSTNRRQTHEKAIQGGNNQLHFTAGDGVKINVDFPNPIFLSTTIDLEWAVADASCKIRLSFFQIFLMSRAHIRGSYDGRASRIIVTVRRPSPTLEVKRVHCLFPDFRKLPRIFGGYVSDFENLHPNHKEIVLSLNERRLIMIRLK